jgi:hypothetical protein
MVNIALIVARQATLPGRKAAAVRPPNQNIENNPMHRKRGGRRHRRVGRASENLLTRRANQGHISILPQFCKRPCPANAAPFHAFAEKTLPTIEVAPARAADDRPGVA